MPEHAPAPAPVTPERLFEMMAGFKYTAVLRAAVELRVFDALADGPLAAAEVAARLDADDRATELLLGALAAVGLLEQREDGTYRAAPGADELLVTTSPRYCGGITRVASSQGEWEALGRLAETVRRGGPAECGPVAEQDGFDYWEVAPGAWLIEDD